MIVHVVVDQAMLNHGRDNRAKPGEFCPVERAITQALGQPMIVGSETFARPHRPEALPLPQRVIALIRAIDWNEWDGLHPIEFDVEIPDDWAK